MPLAAGQRHRAGTDLESFFLLYGFHRTKGSRQAVGGGEGKSRQWTYPVVNSACYNTKVTGAMCPQVQ